MGFTTATPIRCARPRTGTTARILGVRIVITGKAVVPSGPSIGVRTRNLFKKLFLAPAGLGLMAPLAVDAIRPASATDLNVAGIRQYTSSNEQVTSITQFSDVKPTDWAYQALSNLIERYGCVAGYPNGTYKGGQAMTRFEAAALLNACLDRITETTDELKRLLKEFEKELAVMRGKVNGLEAKVGELEATQFSTTTKLSGLATFVIGGNNFTGTNGGPQFTNTEFTTAYNNTKYGATVFEFDLQLAFDTSFTGKDLLRTVLRGGNAGGENGSAYSAGMLTTLEAFYEQPVGDNVMGVFQLFYNFPIGEELSFSFGPLVRNDDPGMLGLWPSVYPSDTMLDLFTYAGAPGAYNTDALGGGGGFVYSPKWAKGLTISQSYVSAEGASFSNGAVTNSSSGNPALGGMFTNGAGSAAVTQIGFAGDNARIFGGSYGIAFAYTYSQNLGVPIGTPLAQQYSDYNADASGYSSGNNFGLSGYWQPSQSGLIPSISWGIGTGTYKIQSGAQNLGGMFTGTAGVTTASWYTGLQWKDVFARGNDFGMAVGQAPYVTQLGGSAAETPRNITTAATGTGATGADDSNYVWEWWYKFQVSDNITVTPALFYVSNLAGQLGRLNQSGGSGTAANNVLGGLLKTTFQF